MSDITITDADGNVQYSLDSKDGTTVGDLLSIIGAGVLRKDGVLKANKNYILVPGTYTLERPPEPKPEPDEYNGISLVERNALRTQFEQQQVSCFFLSIQINETQIVFFSPVTVLSIVVVVLMCPTESSVIIFTFFAYPT
mmetsp:Transcript_4878/g.13667  ORF Transcript_4878/g.13667 Transcript_4878/m.13667 type:complete len:140 (+) Transcript_4878:2686-3105(+)